MSAFATLGALAMGTAAFVKDHPEVVTALEALVTGGHLTEAQSSAMLRAAMVEASDVEMKAELGV